MNQIAIYWDEFLLIAVLHFLAVASPGPDFAVVTRYSISFGGRIGRWVAVGIGTGILLHIAYSVLGVALLIHRYQWLYATLLWVGAIYLGWLGWLALQAKPRGAMPSTEEFTSRASQVSASKAFRVGFLTNGLNVKATLFFLALFSTVIDPATPTLVKIGYGGYMAIATGLWFMALATAITWGPFYRKLWRYSHWLDRLMGLALVLLSLKLIWDWWQL
ncbi:MULTISPECIES: LysE family translocator [Pseudidiomarina]|uniref:Threonine/homoserine/homoserine lactone efflux protein n=3 Tax=Pseudidiomarina TaxID=2800384 RepID=A0A368V5X7_9GAMM|nr:MULTISPECIES: LysE family transporter [Pseudidiomarina]PWW15110.1 threonine/homoserine/homoserine lactone efflux protein [Pseudidiomarina maritima]RBP91654.1 threonine/homoserine/homoserine lactone efflux protein [Pseudidiomarina tainanensis]RCW35084.1 threonine/homoserine/homoserine lactone efflux protein [Pseudidiomarina tainanensis]